MSNFSLPLISLIDLYQVGHIPFYEHCKNSTGYLSFRKSLCLSDEIDQRIVWFGIRDIIDRYFTSRVSEEDIYLASRYLESVNVDKDSSNLFIKVFKRILKENDGRLPIDIWAVEDGSVVYPNSPLVVVRSHDDYACLTPMFEALLLQTWYASAVATYCRKLKDKTEFLFDLSSTLDLADHKRETIIRDWGFRSSTSVDSSIVAGRAFMLSYQGIDSGPAAYYSRVDAADLIENQQIRALSHNCVMSCRTEIEAFVKAISLTPRGQAVVLVMDTTNLFETTKACLPRIYEAATKYGVHVVLRPDSGDNLESIMFLLGEISQCFGSQINAKGYRVLSGASVITGNSLDFEEVSKISEAVVSNGYSIENVAFGLGGGMVHREVSRDKLSASFQLCEYQTHDCQTVDVCKRSVQSEGKRSLLGLHGVDAISRKPFKISDLGCEGNLLKLVYDGKSGEQVGKPKTIRQMRDTVSREWCSLHRS